LETTSPRLSPSPPGDERRVRVLADGPLDARPQALERRRRGRSRRQTGRDCGHTCDDRVVPAENLVRVLVVEAERADHRGDSKWTSETPPQLRFATRLDRVQQAVRLRADEICETGPHRVESERTGERSPVTCVLGPVEGEHAGSDDLCGRKARVVNRERVRIAHHLEREVPPGHEPATTERRQPRDRLPFPQAAEERMGVPLELRDRRGGSQREDGASIVGHVLQVS